MAAMKVQTWKEPLCGSALSHRPPIDAGVMTGSVRRSAGEAGFISPWDRILAALRGRGGAVTERR
jgi:hypothetical protein